MLLILDSKKHRERLKEYCDYLTSKKAKVKIEEVRENRSTRQNRALHLYFTFISNELNNIGAEFNYEGLNDNTFSLKYTPMIVKEFIWKPIQLTMFNKTSTKQINTSEMNDIIDVINKFFSDRGVDIYFPSIDTLIDNQY